MIEKIKMLAFEVGCRQICNILNNFVFQMADWRNGLWTVEDS